MMEICLRCKRETQIYAKGLCMSCYQYPINKNNPNQKISQKKWKKKNKNYWRNYYRKKNNLAKSKWRKK